MRRSISFSHEPRAGVLCGRGVRIVVAALDKFKGTATSLEAAAAVRRAAESAGWRTRVVAMSDGGDGLLDAVGGANRSSVVTGPLGAPVAAAWRFAGGEAVIESARASGLVLAGGIEGNDPVAATSYGTGELVAAAVADGATRIVVGLGGSASTDGGAGAIAALDDANLEALRRGRVELVACCDVRTRFLDAAAVFAPQKGATPDQVVELRDRLVEVRQRWRDRFGVDVADVAGTGAAGGLGGGLLAVGARLVTGFDEISWRARLPEAVRGADLVVTGEGRLDTTSFAGKVVGGVAQLAREHDVPLLAVVGEQAQEVYAPFPVIALASRFGLRRALAEPLGCIEAVVREVLEKD